MNLIKCYEEQPKIPNLSKRVIIKFQEYIEVNNITEDKYFEVIPLFVETLSYSNSTKKGYRNKLRRFLYEQGIQ